MLRRRIFSSAMASVMALSTVAVVAQAEETKAVKTEAELDALVNGDAEGQCGSAWRTGELLDYGSSQTENMLGALDAAEAILDNDEATEEDYTVAWYMVTGVRETLKKYTYDDLQKLIKKAEPKFAKNNIYNEELNDNIYTTDSYAKLEDAYGEATTYTDTSLVPDITDAYIALETALNDLTTLNKVTKSEFRAVMNEYEAILADAHKYDSWRRGTNLAGGNFKATSFGYVYDLVYATMDDITEQYNKFDAIKGLNITTDTEIRGGYDLALEAIKVYKSWAPDADVRGSSAAVKKLLNKYNGVLVYEFAPEVLGEKDGSTTNSLLASIKAAINDADTFDATEVFGENGTELWSTTLSDNMPLPSWEGIKKLIAAEAVVKLKKTVYIPVDKDGKWVKGVDVQAVKPVKATANGAQTGGQATPDDKTDDTYEYLKGEWIVTITDNNQNPPVTTTTRVAGTEVVSYKMLTANSKFDLADFIKIEVADIIDDNFDAYPVENPHTPGDKLYAKDRFILDQAGEFTLTDDDNWHALYNLRTYLTDTSIDSTKVDLETALVIANAYLDGAYADIEIDPNNEKNTDEDQNAKFDQYLDVNTGTGAIEGGALNTAITNADDANGLAANIASDVNDRGDATAIANDIIDVIDETGAVATANGEMENGKAKGHTTEWTLVYRYLQYALSDRYDGAAPGEGAKYTKADVNALVAKATELIDKTGDAAIFNVTNVELVETRQLAREWLADANSDKLYREYTPGVGADGDAYDSSTVMYETLFACYDNLLEEYEALALSYEDVYKKIADTAAAIDNGDIADSADLQDAIKAVAAALSMIDDNTYYYNIGDAWNNRPENQDWVTATDAYLDNAAFDEIREFLGVNRVVTGSGRIAAMNGEVVACNAKQNPTHFALVNALAALDKAIEKATEPEVVVIAGDYNGDGKVSLADCAAILTDYTANTLDQTKSGDFNGDGKISLADCAAILTAYTNEEL